MLAEHVRKLRYTQTELRKRVNLAKMAKSGIKNSDAESELL